MLGLVALSAGLFPSRGHGTQAYGGLPSWLPKAKVQVGRVVVASAARPWRAVEGDTVSVRLARGRVTATAVGPSVPEEGKFPVPATTPCTFTVTLTETSGAVPLRAAAFSIVDERGNLHRPRVSSAGGGALPLELPRRRSVTLIVHDVLPTGNGQLAWAPEGRTPIVSWDFDVEID